jgi:hypothetical protein
MCNGNDHYFLLAGAVEYVERESLKNEFPVPFSAKGQSVGAFEI